MQQLLITIPFVNVPIYGFGAMLFTAFLLCTLWGIRRAKPIGLNKDHVQDLAFIFFITGIIGARLVYMLQYPKQFKFDGVWGTISDFIGIDRGGIVFYGCIIGASSASLAFSKPS